VKRLTTGGLLIFVQLFFACHSGGQVRKNYSIHFRSNTYIPVENVREVVRRPELLSAARFNGYYFVIVQFYSLPDSTIKKRLAEYGITLLHYLPQLAYVTKIPIQSNLTLLSNIKARSIIVLKAEQKMAPELQIKKFPQWAVPSKDYVDITVSTFEPFDLSLLTEPITALNGQVVNVQKEFANITVRLPQKNLVSLAELPFVFWLEAVEEPAKKETIQKSQEQ
jgi:hypothetical protein